MVEWIIGAVAVSGVAGVSLQRLLARRRRAAGAMTIGRLGEAAGSTVELSGRVMSTPTRSPVTWHPCAAWWCWVATLDARGQWQEVGGASSGAFSLEDETGHVELEAAQCRPGASPGAEVVLHSGQWPPPNGTSAFHDALRGVCGAAGLEEPEAMASVRVRESLLPMGATVTARALVVVGPGSEGDGGYRGERSASASLCPPPGGWIELLPR